MEKLSGSSVPIVGKKSWQQMAAHEIKEGGTKSEAEIVGVIRKYSDGIIKHLAEIPVLVEVKAKIPGLSTYQPMLSNVIKAGEDRALAVNNLRQGTFFEDILMEARRVWPAGYKEGCDDHLGR